MCIRDRSPVLMGFMLGGLMKMICTSPLSSMALTAMLGLTGLPMGIACIACVGGAFTNGMIFKMLKLGDKSSTIAVMVEPLTCLLYTSCDPGDQRGRYADHRGNIPCCLSGSWIY